MKKTIALLVAGAALLLSSASARADDGESAAIGILYVVSTTGGIVTIIGTGVALEHGGRSTNGWGVASAVTGVVNVAWGIGFVSYAAGPSDCSGLICLDFRGVAAAFGAVNLTVGVVNLVLAGVAITWKWRPPDQGPAISTLAPLSLRDTRGDPVPGLMAVGRF
jgi:hypothetical protein